jgi:hypothetical protein
LAQKACREGYTAIYQRLPRLFQELPLAKGDAMAVIANSSHAWVKRMFCYWMIEKG